MGDCGCDGGWYKETCRLLGDAARRDVFWRLLLRDVGPLVLYIREWGKALLVALDLGEAYDAVWWVLYVSIGWDVFCRADPDPAMDAFDLLRTGLPSAANVLFRSTKTQLFLVAELSGG